MNGILSAMIDIFTSPTMYSSAVRLGGFLAFAALGELVAEKAGTINISVEGSLLAGAFAGAVGYDMTGSTWVGLLFGMVGFFAYHVQQVIYPFPVPLSICRSCCLVNISLHSFLIFISILPLNISSTISTGNFPAAKFFFLVVYSSAIFFALFLFPAHY